MYLVDKILVEATLKKPNETMTSNVINEIINFLESNHQMCYLFDEKTIQITQPEDRKKITFSVDNVEKVLMRSDYDGTPFIQINFNNKSKVLITKNLVGFKPVELLGFDSTKIPKVVTTVDLKSVQKAIEDLCESEETFQTMTEIEVLKKVYQSIMVGAEAIGFEMRPEKAWFSSFLLNPIAATA